MKFTNKLLLVFFFYPFSGFSQTVPAKHKNTTKGKYFIYWGWNRGYYTKSDFHFQGENYNFNLYDVVAKDKQSKFGLNPYIDPAALTIPQFNARVGYNISNHYSISLGDDHMKYKVVQNQTVKISGTIAVSDYPKYNRTYDNSDIVIAEDFLTLQHCDGLNYLNIELRRQDALCNLNMIEWCDINISFSEGIGIGAVMPRTEAVLLMQERYHEFHFAGYGGAALAALKLELGNHFFIQTELKGGFINLPDIRTSHDKTDWASQHFFFMQNNIVFGYEL
jgi:hypothetical protein